MVVLMYEDAPALMFASTAPTVPFVAIQLKLIDLVAELKKRIDACWRAALEAGRVLPSPIVATGHMRGWAMHAVAEQIALLR